MQPKIGDVLVRSDKHLLIVGSTRGGWLTVDLTRTVELSDHGLQNSGCELTSLEKVLPLASRKGTA